MKLLLSASLLSALCLSGNPHSSVEAFVPQPSRFTNTSPLVGPKQTGSPLHRQEDSSLKVSFIQDRLKEIGDTIDPNDNNAFMQQLKKPISFSQRELGLLVLLTVPVAWGTYASTVQSIYNLDIQVPGFIFSTCYFFVAASGSLVATGWNSAQQQNKGETETAKAVPAVAGLELGFYVYLANFLHVIGLQTVPSDRAGFLFQLTTVMVPMLEAFFARDLMAIPPSTWGACALALAGIFVMGMEWPFGVPEVAQAAMDSAEQVTEYTAETFQADLASASAAAVDSASTALEQSGVLDSAQAVMDSTQALADSGNSVLSSVLSGDALIVGAAFLYALQIIRISKWTKEYSPLQIMTGKTCAELFFSVLFVGGTAALASSGMDLAGANGALAFLQSSGQQSLDFFHTATQGLTDGTVSAGTLEHFAGACLWTGLITTCYLVFAQSYGQQYVKASDANLIYSLQPLFTAIFAYYLLGETLQPMGYVGGACIFAAVYLVASKSLIEEEA